MIALALDTCAHVAVTDPAWEFKKGLSITVQFLMELPLLQHYMFYLWYPFLGHYLPFLLKTKFRFS